jgi:hypothetical protein
VSGNSEQDHGGHGFAGTANLEKNPKVISEPAEKEVTTHWWECRREAAEHGAPPGNIIFMEECYGSYNQ